MPIRLTDPPGANRDSVLAMLRMICPDGDLRVDPDGSVVIQNAAACRDARPGCRCVCHMVSFSGDTTIQVVHDLSVYGGGATLPANPADGVLRPDGQMGRGTTSSIEIENRNRYQMQHPTDPNTWIDEPDWITLAHELCGHALHRRRGDHPRSGSTPPADPDWHKQAQDATAEIRRERGLPPVNEAVGRLRPGA